MSQISFERAQHAGKPPGGIKFLNPQKDPLWGEKPPSVDLLTYKMKDLAGASGIPFPYIHDGTQRTLFLADSEGLGAHFVQKWLVLALCTGP